MKVCHSILTLVLPALIFAGCGKVETDITDSLSPRVSGSLGGSSWSFSSAIARRSPAGGYEVTVAGRDDLLTCGFSRPTSSHLTFNVPAQTGRYAFDETNPSGGSAPVFAVILNPGRAPDTILPRSSVVELNFIGGSTLSGSVSWESSDFGSRGGSLSGSFEATLCDQISPPPVIGPVERLRGMAKNWYGRAAITDDNFSPYYREVLFDFGFGMEGEREILTLGVRERQDNLYFWQARFLVSEAGIFQSCIAPGSPERRWISAGTYNERTRTFEFSPLSENCGATGDSLRFTLLDGGDIRLASFKRELGGVHSRSVSADSMRKL